jgi:hypothetical protein
VPVGKAHEGRAERAAGFREDPHHVVGGCHDGGLGAGRDGRRVMRLKGERGSARARPPRRASRGRPSRAMAPASPVRVCNASPSSLLRRGYAVWRIGQSLSYSNRGVVQGGCGGRRRCRSREEEAVRGGPTVLALGWPGLPRPTGG